MKKLALCLLAAAIFFSACGKDPDANQTPANGFTYNGEDIGTPYGYLTDWGTDGSQIVLAGKDLQLEGLSTNVSAVGIDLDTIISGQTYTFKSTDSAGYDKKLNFASAVVYNDQPFANGKFTAAAKRLDSLTEGTVTLRIEEGFYSVVYDLKYVSTTVKGEYNGVLTLVR
jgi:hypothetical protein